MSGNGRQASVADLATSWENPDDRDWLFHIREDVHFQTCRRSGRSVTAQDIVNSMTRLRTLPGASPDKNIIKIEAPDLRTVVLQTEVPDGYMLMNIGSLPNAVVPIEAVDAFGDLKEHAIGSGPFVLDSVSRDELVVTRNPDYYHDFPYVDGIDVRALVEAASRQAVFRAGDIDVYTADNRMQADALKSVPGTSTERYLSAVYSVFALNAVKVEAFKDERVREAIDRADRNARSRSAFRCELSVDTAQVDTAHRNKCGGLWRRKLERAVSAAAGPHNLRTSFTDAECRPFRSQRAPGGDRRHRHLPVGEVGTAGKTVRIRFRSTATAPSLSDYPVAGPSHLRLEPQPAGVFASRMRRWMHS
jgi:hypothetical protein